MATPESQLKASDETDSQPKKPQQPSVIERVDKECAIVQNVTPVDVNEPRMSRNQKKEKSGR